MLSVSTEFAHKHKTKLYLKNLLPSFDKLSWNAFHKWNVKRDM